MRFIHNIEFIIRNLVDDEFKDKIDIRKPNSVCFQLDEKTYWKLHEEISKEFKHIYPKWNHLQRGIYFWNKITQILAKEGIYLQREE